MDSVEPHSAKVRLFAIARLHAMNKPDHWDKKNSSCFLEGAVRDDCVFPMQEEFNSAKCILIKRSGK
jgi:hypothetical protein